MALAKGQDPGWNHGDTDARSGQEDEARERRSGRQRPARSPFSSGSPLEKEERVVLLLFLLRKTDERVAAGRRGLALRASLRVLAPPCPRVSVVNPLPTGWRPRLRANGFDRRPA